MPDNFVWEEEGIVIFAFQRKQKVLTAEAMRTLLFYSDKHINVNIMPIEYSALHRLRIKVFFSIVQIQRKIADLSIFWNYFPSLIAACVAISEK